MENTTPSNPGERPKKTGPEPEHEPDPKPVKFSGKPQSFKIVKPKPIKSKLIPIKKTIGKWKNE